MSNVKISQLPYQPSVTDQAILPVVEGGTTYSTAITDIVDAIAPGSIQEVSNITQSIYTDGTSTTKYPSAAATKDYADGLVVGLLDDRGNYTPGVVSPGAYPSTGGSGTAGAILKGDIWFIAASGYLGTTAVTAGQSVRALSDAPGQTAANWNILNVAGFTNPPETTNNKVTSKADFISNGSSIVKYPSILAVKQYIDEDVTLQSVIDNSNNLVDGLNLQGTGAGAGMGAVTDVNAFGQGAGGGNTASNGNFFGNGAGNANTGDNVNAFGQNAGINNTGSQVNGFGDSAAYDNTGDHVNGYGTNAANNNSGNFINSFGQNAGYDNQGNNVNAFGVEAAKTNQNDHLNAFGNNAGYNNQGDDVNAFGFEAGKNNTGDGLNALGNSAGQGNTGKNVNAFGTDAGLNNTFDSVNLFGQEAIADAANQAVFSKDNGLSAPHNVRISYNNTTTDRKLEIPDVSGTLVASVNGVVPNAQGDVTLPIPNSNILSTTVVLTSSDLLNLYTTPITLIGGIPGKIIYPIQFYIQYDFGTTPYVTAADTILNFGYPANITFLRYNAIFNFQSYYNFAKSGDRSATDSPVGRDLTVAKYSAPLTGGDGTLTVHITYELITI